MYNSSVLVNFKHTVLGTRYKHRLFIQNLNAGKMQLMGKKVKQKKKDQFHISFFRIFQQSNKAVL